MVSSQEAALGIGWNYTHALEPFAHGTLEPREFATHIANVFERSQKKITNDYAQSAIDLDAVGELEEHISTIARLLAECLKLQKGRTVKNAIKTSRSKMLCTYFYEPSYIDLHHLLTNLALNVKHFEFADTQKEAIIVKELKKALSDGKIALSELFWLTL